jgi:hypothetical protein
VRLSNLRYTGGTTTYLEVLDGQRALLPQNLLWHRRAATNTKASYNFTGCWVEAGSFRSTALNDKLMTE